MSKKQKWVPITLGELMAVRCPQQTASFARRKQKAVAVGAIDTGTFDREADEAEREAAAIRRAAAMRPRGPKGKYFV